MRSFGSAFFCVPGMLGSLEVKVLYPSRRRRRVSEAQGRRCEAGSEGSVEQSRDSTDRNRIRGSYGRTSEQKVTKSIPIKGPGCKSGGCAVKVVRLTSGDLRRVRWWTEETARSPDRVAEVSRGHSRSFGPKARTERSGE